MSAWLLARDCFFRFCLVVFVFVCLIACLLVCLVVPFIACVPACLLA